MDLRNHGVTTISNTMIDKLNQVLRGRFLVLFIFSGLFALLAFGQMGLFKTGEIPYPSQHVLEVKQFSSSNEEFFTNLDNFADSHDLIFYRSVYSQGKIKGFVFGETPLTATLTKDAKLLETITPVGMYFVDGNLNKVALSDLEKLNIKAESASTGWHYIAADLLFGFSIRTTTFWISVLLYAVSLLAFKIATLKKVLIARTLGYNKLGILREILTMAIGLTSVALLIMFFNNYFVSMLSNSYALIIGVIYVMLTLLIVLVNLVFAIYIKTIPIIAILKNKQKGAVFSYIWLLVIMISISLMALALTSYSKGYEAARVRKASFTKWEKIDKMAQLSVTMPSFERFDPEQHIRNGLLMTKEEMEKRAKEEEAYYGKWRKFDNAFKASEKLFIESPRELEFLDATSNNGKTDAQDFHHPEKIIQIENKWIAKTWQVSPSLVKLSTEVVESNPRIFQDKTAVTIYIPKKYISHKEEIIPVVTSNIIGSDLSDGDISVIEIPDDFTLFNADVTQIKDSEKPFLTVKDAVIAQYDADKMPDSARGNSFLSKYMGFNTLYQEDKIAQALKKSGLTADVIDYANVFDNIKSYQKQIDEDMTRSIIVAIALFILEIYVLYTFLSLRLSIVSRKLTILQFLGQSNLLPITKQVIPLILMNLMALCLAYAQGAALNIILLLSCVYLLLIVGLTSVILMKIRRTRIQILKGEEILL